MLSVEKDFDTRVQVETSLQFEIHQLSKPRGTECCTKIFLLVLTWSNKISVESTFREFVDGVLPSANLGREQFTFV